MALDPFRQIFRPLFGVERREIAAQFLYAILISALVIEAVMIVLRVLSGVTLLNSTGLRLLIILLFLELILLFVVRRGYSNAAALTLVALSWVGVTYQAWSADGIRDVAIYVYLVIIFVAALLINWQIPVALSILSILSIWVFALTEALGLRSAHVDSPLNMARDLTAIFIIFFLL